MAEAPALPVWCAEVDLAPGRPPLPPAPAGARSVRVLVRLDGNPLGYVTAPAHPGPDDAALLAGLPAGARDRVRARRAGAPATDALADVPTDVRVSVVVCTRDRPQVLARCLEHLGRLTYPDLELLVVDNAPSDEATRAVVSAAAARDPRVVYARQEVPGLSHARNRGLELATGDVVAYTDDDVRVDPWWVHGLVRGFSRRPDVACVTGLAVAAALDTEVEAYFDARVSWSTLREPRVYDLATGAAGGAMYPYAAGLFGTGANVAFRRADLLRRGGFDALLGAGTPTRGGEDLDAFVQTVVHGGAVAVEPSAVVWHHHRSTPADLAQQMYGYGTGLTAFYTKLLLDPRTRPGVLRVVPAGLARLAGTVAGVRRRDRSPRAGSTSTSPVLAPAAGLLRRELTGMLAGPALYLRARAGRA
ncbi:glycosyltransferase family 2 protein [Kineococcus sp. LSe6-4]|uniref:Glycosyltransferase family 2 protein n=1 Tax=Kineococcus halophytocola TaxID=3234027 RepID=A0ABV4GXV3_9ACTN